MNIVQETHQYERWLGQHTILVRPDLVLKHALMKRDAFSFFGPPFIDGLRSGETSVRISAGHPKSWPSEIFMSKTLERGVTMKVAWSGD